MEKYLDTEFECECGQTHKLTIKDIIIENNALEKVPDLLEKYTDKDKVYLICDHNTLKAAGEKLKGILTGAGYQVKSIVLEDKHVVPDPDTLFEILSKIDRDGYIIACGSGSINDATRYLSYKMAQPYLIAATAPSMDGYASAVAPLTIGGVKQTYQAVSPEAIVADINVLKNAPLKMIQAGMGDLLGKTTSLLDWRLSEILFDEYYCPRAVDIVNQELSKILKIGHKLKERDAESIKVLTRGLIYSGLAMLMVNSSRPASGSEHHISHFLEMYGEIHRRPLPLHGIKVGLGTYFTCAFYLQLLKMDFSQLEIKDNREERYEHIKKVYGDRASLPLDNLQERWQQEKLDQELLIQKEPEIKQAVENRYDYLHKSRSYLGEIGVLQREDVKNIDRQWLEKALKYGFEIRARFTVTTLLNQVGYLEQLCEELTAQWEAEK